MKLCDFGSATIEQFYPDDSWNNSKRTYLEEEVDLETISSLHKRTFLQMQRHTTPMYRAPEILDTYQNFAVGVQQDVWVIFPWSFWNNFSKEDRKEWSNRLGESDWVFFQVLVFIIFKFAFQALGCVLYFLCTGVHPFQDSAKLAILNVKYSIPAAMREGPNSYFLPLIGLLFLFAFLQQIHVFQKVAWLPTPLFVLESMTWWSESRFWLLRSESIWLSLLRDCRGKLDLQILL